MIRYLLTLVLATGLAIGLCSAAQANPQRIIAVGDVHGDHGQFVKILEATGLVDSRQRWIGGDTHLVQLGDLPDRGPDTRKTMDLLIKLQESAAKDGGTVTVLIGNHDMMNVMDDLRYVHPGEYKAFKTRSSKTLRSNYYKQVVTYLTENLPEEERPAFDKTWRREWEAKHPLGYVEHRMAWAATGTYGQWVMERPTVAVIGNSLFVHGGISPAYASMSVADMNAAVHEAMAGGYANADESILYDAEGPLWFRGWSQGAETMARDAALSDVLQALGVERMVVAHTPALPVVLPRFGGKLLMVDVGLSGHYGHGFSALKIEGDQLTAMVGGDWFELPSEANALTITDYLMQVRDTAANPERIDRYVVALEEAALEAQKEATEPN